jgi:hypothetical protein
MAVRCICVFHLPGDRDRASARLTPLQRRVEQRAPLTATARNPGLPAAQDDLCPEAHKDECLGELCDAASEALHHAAGPDGPGAVGRNRGLLESRGPRPRAGRSRLFWGTAIGEVTGYPSDPRATGSPAALQKVLHRVLASAGEAGAVARVERVRVGSSRDHDPGLVSRWALGGAQDVLGTELRAQPRGLEVASQPRGEGAGCRCQILVGHGSCRRSQPTLTGSGSGRCRRIS